MVGLPNLVPSFILTSQGHTCHIVGENLIIIGGMETTDAGSNVKSCAVSTVQRRKVGIA